MSKLSSVQAEVACAVAQGSTITAAARAAGLNRGTIYKWLKTVPEFAEAVKEARTEYVHTLSDEMKELSAKALATVRDLLENPETPPHVRLRTALAILQRPQFPDPGWSLPDSVNTRREQEVLQSVAELEAAVRAFDARNELSDRILDRS